MLYLNIRNWIRLIAPWSIISFGKQGGIVQTDLFHFISVTRYSYAARVSLDAVYPKFWTQIIEWCWKKHTETHIHTHARVHTHTWTPLLPVGKTVDVHIISFYELIRAFLLVSLIKRCSLRILLLVIIEFSPSESQRAINYNYQNDGIYVRRL